MNLVLVATANLMLGVMPSVYAHTQGADRFFIHGTLNFHHAIPNAWNLVHMVGLHILKDYIRINTEYFPKAEWRLKCRTQMLMLFELYPKG